MTRIYNYPTGYKVLASDFNGAISQLDTNNSSNINPNIYNGFGLGVGGLEVAVDSGYGRGADVDLSSLISGGLNIKPTWIKVTGATIVAVPPSSVGWIVVTLNIDSVVPGNNTYDTTSVVEFVTSLTTIFPTGVIIAQLVLAKVTSTGVLATLDTTDASVSFNSGYAINQFSAIDDIQTQLTSTTNLANALNGTTAAHTSDIAAINAILPNKADLVSSTVPLAQMDIAVTQEGNTFNIASTLVKLDADAKLPIVDGSNLTGILSTGISASSSTIGLTPNIFVVSSESNTGILYSLDGITWVASNVTSGTFSTPIFAFGTFYIVAKSGQSGVWRSIDGKTWTQLYGIGNYGSITISSLNGVLVALSNNNNGIIYSNNAGLTWGLSNLTTGSFNGVVYGGSLFVATSNTQIYSSPDGATWVTGTGYASDAFNAPYYANGLYVVPSNANTGILVSNNGKAWAQTNITTGAWGSLNFYNNTWVVSSLNTTAGQGGIYTSQFGKIWTIGTGASINNSIFTRNCIWFNNGNWVAASGNDKGIFYSTDNAKTWAQSNLATGNFTSITYGKSVWVATYATASNLGIVQSADNGITWVVTGLTTLAYNSLYFARYAMGYFDAVGKGSSYLGGSNTEVAGNLYIGGKAYDDSLSRLLNSTDIQTVGIGAINNNVSGEQTRMVADNLTTVTSTPISQIMTFSTPFVGVTTFYASVNAIDTTGGTNNILNTTITGITSNSITVSVAKIGGGNVATVTLTAIVRGIIGQ